jgi:DNA-binding transcriptional LysR family regulator
MTQPAVSNALRRLREALGDDLVRRSGYGVEPTPRALACGRPVSDALRQLEASLAPGDFVAAEGPDHLCAGHGRRHRGRADARPGRNHGGRRAGGVHAGAAADHARPAPPAGRRQIDMAVGFFPPCWPTCRPRHRPAARPPSQHQRLYDGEYVCVMRQGHPLAAGRSPSRYCAAHHLLVSFSGRPFGFIDEALASLGQKRRIVLTVNQFFTAGRVVASSDLLTVLPRHFVNVTGMARRAGRCARCRWTCPPVHVDALWHRRREREPAHAWLRLAVQAAAKRAFAKPLSI